MPPDNSRPSAPRPSPPGAAAPTAPAHASVVPSSDPAADAEAVMRLLPGRYKLERPPAGGVVSSSSSLKQLVGTGVGGGGCDLILLVRALPGGGSAGGSDVATAAARRAIPSAAVVLDDGEAEAAIGRLWAEDLDAAAAASGGAAGPGWGTVLLPGGSTLLLASRTALASPEGRIGLAEAVSASPGGARGASPDVPNGGLNRAAAGVGSRRPLGEGRLDGGGGPDDDAPPPPPPYGFPSLSMDILSGGEVVPGFRINSRVGIPINTDLFEGRILLIMRPPNPEDDPYWHEKVFSKKKRRFEVQVQGRFKYTPKGPVYCGAEVSEEMKLGLVSKGLCNMLLKLLTKMVPAELHFSFGGKDKVEMPHIVFTAWSFFDRVVVTKPGGTPPPMGEPFPESDKAAAVRKKSSSDVGRWSPDNIYSLSFNSMYLDLPTWHLKNVPMMKDMDLRTFWGDSLLRIVIYEKCSNRKDGRHVTADNKYLITIQTEFLGITDDAGKKRKLENGDSLPWNRTRPSISRSISSLSLVKEDAESQEELSVQSQLPNLDESEDDVESESSEVTAFFDAKETQSQGSDVGLDLDTVEGSEENVVVVPVAPVNQYCFLPADMLCPGWVEMCSGKGKYSKVYAFVAATSLRAVFRSSSDFVRFFSVEDAKRRVQSTVSPRASSAEKLRRIMGQTLESAAQGASAEQMKRYHTFMRKTFEHDNRFLRRGRPFTLKIKVRGKIDYSGWVARALSERHWIEEWAVATDRHVSFFHPESKRPNFRVSLQGILAVHKLPAKDCPNFPGCHVLAVATTGRRIYLMYYSEEECSRWQAVFSHAIISILAEHTRPEEVLCCTSSRGSALYDELLALDDPTEEFLHKTSVFSCKQRRVLNCRKLFFNSLGQNGVVQERKNRQHPCDLVEEALRRALEPIEDSESSNLRAFLDSAADLKTVNVADLTEAEKLAFFLNLYHVMVMHAYLVLGSPDSSFKWVSYFNMISYQCSDDIFSLTELEHCIIRAQMSSPSQFVAKFALPKSHYSFELGYSRKTRRNPLDFRINFALNCGSLSNPHSVVIFRPDTINEQLDDSARQYLLKSVKVTKSSRKGAVSVTLPRVCSWYADDFRRGRMTDIVLLVMKYLRRCDQELLATALANDGQHFRPGSIHISFSSYDYHCRHLTLRED